MDVRRHVFILYTDFARQTRQLWGKRNNAFLSPLMMFADAEIFSVIQNKTLKERRGEFESY